MRDIYSIVQIRNILQGAIQYIKDWFTYITEMIYDLLGFELSWMSSKTDLVILKTRIIQLIYVLKAIIEAIAKNGLECGTSSNFSPAQLKFILEEELNKFTATQFKVQPDGTIEISPPGRTPLPDVEDLTEHIEDLTSPDVPEGAEDNKANKQKGIKSGVIIKDCLKDVSTAELERTRSWISEFERRGGGDG